MYILLLLGEVFYKYQLILLVDGIEFFIFPDFLSSCSITLIIGTDKTNFFLPIKVRELKVA